MTFEQRKLSELCTKITDGSHFSPKEVAEGFPMYSVKDMTQFGFSDTSVKRISEDDYHALVKADCVPRVNDVLIAKDGSVLKHVFSVNSEIKGALLSSIAILRPNLDYVDSDFLVYALQDPELRNEVLSNYVSGSGVPRIVLKDFKNIPIQAPPLETQKAISYLLKSLDRKIQANLAVSQSLENIAQAIFKSWFIDFDPVKAKVAGGSSMGIDDETASLFPDSM
jgi:type I restriction enzyme, S subunit